MDAIKKVLAVLWEEGRKPTPHVKSPGFYSDIGKPARDILYDEYDSQQFSFTCLPLFTFLGNTEVTNSMTDGVFDFSASHRVTRNLQASVTFVDDKTPGKLEVRFLRRRGALSATWFASSPTVTYSVALGGRGLFLGNDVSFDARAGDFTKCDFGVSFTHLDTTVALILREMGDVLNASYHHERLTLRYKGFTWLEGTTRVAADLTHRFSTAETTIVFGVRHKLDGSTSVGARVRSSGKVMALLEHGFGYLRPRALVTVSGEVDLRRIGSGAKIGLAIAME